MALIAKRKVGATWRASVTARAAEAGVAEACLAAFDQRIATGGTEAEAAFRSLAAFDLLWTVELPGEAAAAAPLLDPHDVPVA